MQLDDRELADAQDLSGRVVLGTCEKGLNQLV